jgi:CRISPR-associated exonuclease Cas4
MSSEDDELLPISALEHLLYCERQCALIHVLGVWRENEHTAAGRVVHERADGAPDSQRPGVRVVRSLSVRSIALGLRGIADVVEFRGPAGDERAYPVEYKRGARRQHAHDDVQLAAQAIALEEMTGRPVPEGAVFHAKSKRRRIVHVDARLRALTADAARRLHLLVAGRRVPPPVHDARCDACSLASACMPDVESREGALERAIREALS